MKQLSLIDFHDKSKPYSPFKKIEYEIKKATNYYACKFLSDLAFRSNIKKVISSISQEQLLENKYRDLQFQLVHFFDNYKRNLDFVFLLLKHNKLNLNGFCTEEGYSLRIEYEDPLGKNESSYCAYIYKEIYIYANKILNPHSIISIRLINRLEDFDLNKPLDSLMNKKKYREDTTTVSFNFDVCDIEENVKYFSGLRLQDIIKTPEFIFDFKDFVRT